MKTPRKHKSTYIENLSSQITPQEQYITDRKMLLALKISNALKTHKLTKKQFAQQLNRKPSEISKWLSGTHNFTIETLIQIEQALSINLIDVDNFKKNKMKIYKTNLENGEFQNLHIKKTENCDKSIYAA